MGAMRYWRWEKACAEIDPRLTERQIRAACEAFCEQQSKESFEKLLARILKAVFDDRSELCRDDDAPRRDFDREAYKEADADDD